MDIKKRKKETVAATVEREDHEVERADRLVPSGSMWAHSQQTMESRLPPNTPGPQWASGLSLSTLSPPCEGGQPGVAPPSIQTEAVGTLIGASAALTVPGRLFSLLSNSVFFLTFYIYYVFVCAVHSVQ